MNYTDGSNILVKSFPISQIDRSTAKKWFYWFCVFWVAIAGLEFIQDYISASLNNYSFGFLESASYKIFWLIFIPFSVMMGYGLKKTRAHFAGVNYVVFNLFLIAVITLFHLILFSFLLFGISFIIHSNPWDLTSLISDKLSTRLYIGLSIYAVMALITFFLKDKEFSKDLNRQSIPKTFTVKNGRKSIPVKVDEIKWINSDGPYVNIYTNEKTYVELGSLKSIITTLPDKFKRIHRSTIANTEMIKEFKSRLNGDYDVVMSDGEVLRLSRNYREELNGILR